MSVTAISSATRFDYVDRVRGLAVLLMICDHLLLVLVAPVESRWFLTRLAMPLFMLLAGSLVRRLTFRHLGVAVLGLWLPLAVPWIDAPNILLLYVLGAVLVVLGRRVSPAAPVLLVALSLTLLGNGVSGLSGGYPVAAVVGLVALGALIPVTSWAPLGRVLPRWMTPFGRFPLSIYVGHLLLLQLVILTTTS